MSGQCFTLSNGLEMPAIGLGTWQVEDGEPAYRAVRDALNVGYRHIDTAHAYGNEASVGRAVRDSPIPRDEIFVTSKLPAEIKEINAARESFAATMTTIGLEQLDLYLIHAPWPWEQMGEEFTLQNRRLWRFFEEILKSGRVRAIGVSNFNATDLQAIVDDCEVVPMVNQIKYYVGNTQDEVTTFCKRNAIQVAGFSPLATGAILQNTEVRAIAQHYGASVAQLCVRYVVQKGVVTLPKSTHTERMRENLMIDFTIDDHDMSALDHLRNTVTVHQGPKL